MQNRVPAVRPMTIRLETHVAVAVERVWAVLGTVEGMKRWFPNLDEYEPRVGGRIAFHYPLAGEPLYRMYGEVLTFDPPRELAFSWVQEEIGGSVWPVPTVVTIRLEPLARGTHVLLTHSRFEQLPKDIAAQAYADYLGGWTGDNVLGRLKAMLEAAA